MNAGADEGATATEYAILLAGIAAVVVIAIMAYGLFLQGKWTTTTTNIETQVTTLSSN